MSFTVHHPRISGIKVEGLSAAERDAHKKAGWMSSGADTPGEDEKAQETPSLQPEDTEEPAAAPASKPKRRKK